MRPERWFSRVQDMNLHEFIFNCRQTKEMEVDRKFPRKYCFEFYSIRKSRIQERAVREFSQEIQ